MADEVNGVASSDQSLSTLFSSHVRQASASLPQWRAKAPSSEKEKLGRGRWDPRDVPILHRVQSFAGLLARRAKFRIALALVSLLIIGIIYLTRKFGRCSASSAADDAHSTLVRLSKIFIPRRRE